MPSEHNKIVNIKLNVSVPPNPIDILGKCCRQWWRGCGGSVLLQIKFQPLMKGEVRMKQVYVPENEITSLPSGWNGEDTVLHSECSCTPFDFLNDPREDVYSLEDGEEIKCQNITVFLVSATS